MEMMKNNPTSLEDSDLNPTHRLKGEISTPPPPNADKSTIMYNLMMAFL
jgi:hypothetical protein